MQTHTLPTYQEQKWLIAISVANLRQQLPPSFKGALAGDQNYPPALLLGTTTPFGGGAAIYVWDAASVAADNGSTVIVPDNAQVGGNPGRWRLLGSAL